MKAEDLIALNEEIAGMARAGLPMDQGLEALAREMGGGRLRQVTTEIAADLRAGHTLPEALERQQGRVPPFYSGLVAAGVRTGRVGEVLATLTTYARTITGMRTTVVDALFYPAVVLLFALALFGFVCAYVLPRFEEIFRDFGLKLPWITEAVLKLGRHPMELVVIPALGLVLGIVVAYLILRLTPRGRRARIHLVYAVPVAGTLIRSARLAAFTELLAILVDHETPLPEAFRLAGRASSDPLMAETAEQIHTELSGGRPLSEVLRGRGLVPEWVAWMAGLGERRGNLGETLHKIADTYRRQVEMRAALLRTVLPPFLVIVTAGAFVCFFVFALMMPLVRLLDGLSK